MTTIILLADKNLAKGAIQAANNSGKMTVALKQACELWINNKSNPARDAIENFAKAISHNKDARKKFTQQLSLASKKVRKANGIEKPCGLKVDKAGNLTDAPQHKTPSAGGEGSQLVPNLSAPVQPTPNGDAIERLRKMLKASKCVEERAALKIGIAAIAASM